MIERHPLLAFPVCFIPSVSGEEITASHQYTIEKKGKSKLAPFQTSQKTHSLLPPTSHKLRLIKRPHLVSVGWKLCRPFSYEEIVTSTPCCHSALLYIAYYIGENLRNNMPLHLKMSLFLYTSHLTEGIVEFKNRL